jgi:hypothetical protein
MTEHRPASADEWPVEFHFKLQGVRELGNVGTVFAARIAVDPCVVRVTDVCRPRAASIRVNAIVSASTFEEARLRSDEILDAARTATGKAIPDWSTTGWWCGHDYSEPMAEP